MSELVYPKPREPGWSRLQLMALGVAFVVALVLLGIFVDWSMVIGPTLVGMVLAPLMARPRTVVSADDITVRGYLRTAILPVSEIGELYADGALGGEVYAVTHVGRRHQLLRVKLEDAEEISELTGLGIRGRG